MIEVYTRPSCPRCVEMKGLLRKRGIEFVECVLDFDVPTSEVKTKFPGIGSLPILSVGGHAIGGLEELENLIERDQLKYLLPPF